MTTMNGSAKERSAAFELTWSVGTDNEARVLTLDYQIEAFEELYVSDRLWDYGPGKQRIPDPFGVYRFVTDGTLRLVFSQAPYPSNVDPSIIFQPLYSRVGAGETRRASVRIELPVDEYSALSRNVAAPTALETVSRAMLIMSYRLRSDMPADPAPPPNETPEQAGYIVYNAKLVTSTIEGLAIPVKRRTGYMARFALPGEPPPGPRPDAAFPAGTQPP